MNQTIEISIVDVLTRIENKIDKLENKIDKVSDDVNSVKTDIARLDAKVMGLDKRVENLEFIARTVGGGIVVALLLGLTKFFFPQFSV